jgi:ParB-like chromosome segregation protein Spo0J
MYQDQLISKKIKLANIFLDPNNPRFWDERTTREIADRKVPDPKIQLRIRDLIDSEDIHELADNIMRNGFLTLDRVVVRELAGVSGSYVVVEGNRRIAALKKLRDAIEDDLIDEENISDEYLERFRISTDEIEVLVYNGSEHDIAWLLQGIRHISGIKAWKPAQRARLVAQQIDNGLSITAAGQKFGLSPQRAGRYYRAYKALEQMRSDEDFQSKAKNEYFTLFDEAYGNTTIRKWLNWDETLNTFKNIENLRHFYSWITPDEEFGDKRRIHDPSHIKKLAVLIAGKHDNLLNAIDVHEIMIDSAFDQASDRGNDVDWKSKIRRATSMISELGKILTDTNPKEVCGELDTHLSVVEKIKTMARALEQ